MIYFQDTQVLNERLEDIEPDDYSKWIRFCLTDSKDYSYWTGSENNIFTLKLSKNYPHWADALFDFIQYEEGYDKNIILEVSQEDYEWAKNKYGTRCYQDYYIRNYEPEVLVHSTTWDAWEKIQLDRCLKSWNLLKKENPSFESHPIGKQLGDPQNYSDYIMFSNGHVAGEIVVLSKQNGFIDMDPFKKYKTGARLYFDMKLIAEDGLLVRDGAHLKVKDKLPLEKYLIWIGTWENTGLSNQTSTPLEFTLSANQTFNRLFNKKIEPHKGSKLR